MDELRSSDVPLPKVITTEFSSSERYSLVPFAFRPLNDSYVTASL